MQKDLFALRYCPKWDLFSSAEQSLIQKLKTPEQVQNFLYDLPYNHEETGETIFSFRKALKQNRAHCLEGALIAATILEQHGYPPLLLDMESKDGIDHVLFLFKENDLWGTVGTSRDIGLHGRRPIFKTLEDLVSSYFDPYINLEACITGYAKVDLNQLGTYNWRFSSRKLIKLERFLINYPHLSFTATKERYLEELKYYKDFKKKHPDKEPPAEVFDNRHEWWQKDK